MAQQYKYAVRIGRKDVAFSTTRREAEHEARRVGGTVHEITPKKNPAGSSGAAGFDYEAQERALLDWRKPGLTRDADDAIRAYGPVRALRHAVEASKSFMGSTESDVLADKARAEALVRSIRLSPQYRAARVVEGGPTGPYAPASTSPVLRGIKYEPNNIVRSYPEYCGTILAPKSLVPVSFYSDGEEDSDAPARGVQWVAVSPDLSRMYGKAYTDRYEHTHEDDGEVRLHMSPGIMQSVDRGRGLGTALYLGAAVVVFKTDERVPYAFSSGSDSGGCEKHQGRSFSASDAWRGMRKSGLAKVLTTNSYTRERIDTDDLVTAGEPPIENITDIDSISPGSIVVDGSSECKLDTITPRLVFGSGLLLDFAGDPAECYDMGRLNVVPVPADLFSKIDFSCTNPDDILRFISFCSTRGDRPELGDESPSFHAEYCREAIEAVSNNPTIKAFDHTNASQLQLEGFGNASVFGGRGFPSTRKNPGRAKHMSDAASKWLAKFGPESGDWE